MTTINVIYGPILLNATPLLYMHNRTTVIRNVFKEAQYYREVFMRKHVCIRRDRQQSCLFSESPNRKSSDVGVCHGNAGINQFKSCLNSNYCHFIFRIAEIVESPKKSSDPVKLPPTKQNGHLVHSEDPEQTRKSKKTEEHDGRQLADPKRKKKSMYFNSYINISVLIVWQF